MSEQEESVERIIGRQAYTPSLDEGREAYVVAMTRNHDSYLMGVSLAEARAVHGQDFDRMIEAVRAEEREKAARIVENAVTEVGYLPGPGETAGANPSIVRLSDIAALIRAQGKEQS